MEELRRDIAAALLISHWRSEKTDFDDLLAKDRWDANPAAFQLYLAFFISTDRKYWIGNPAAFGVALIFCDQTLGNNAGKLGIVPAAGLVAITQHALKAWDRLAKEIIEAMRKRIGNLDFDCASHCVYHLAAHTIFCTKFRRQTLTPEKRDFIESIMRVTAQAYKAEIFEWNGEGDHIHFLLRYPPTAVLSDLVGALKSKSASAVLDQFGSVYTGKHLRTFWSSGFFLCSVGGATLEILKQYIENQGR
jgi:putative transposase